jgi:hypothetical protein
MHDCAPGLSLDEFFASGPPHERPVFDAVIEHLETVGPVHLDIVAVGIFVKNPRKVAELRPKDRWVAVGFALDRRATHATITRKVTELGRRYWHVANVRGPDDVDVALRDLLTEAYELAAPVDSSGGIAPSVIRTRPTASSQQGDDASRTTGTGRHRPRRP